MPKLFLIAAFLLACVGAQTSQDLIGTWEAQTQGIRIIQTIKEDGTYTFEVPSQNYLEKGTWQLDGTAYSQQWQDPKTGEAQVATYALEFLSADSFRQSGGNLEGTVYTFNKVGRTAANPLSPSAPAASTITLRAKDTLVQLPPPEAGEYRCSHSYGTFRVTPDLTGEPGDSLPVYGVGHMESLVGNLVLDGNGNYTMTKSQGKGGTYTFDPSTNKLTFMGELEPFPIDYFVEDGWFTIRLNFLDENNKEETSLSCERQSPNAVTPTTATPNPGLPGTLGLHAKEGQIIRFVAETGAVQIIGTGMQPYQGANGETIFVSSSGYFGDYPVFTILAPDGTLASRLEIDDSKDISESNSMDDILAEGFGGIPEASEPVLSDDGTLIAYSSVDDLGSKNLTVRRRNGDSSKVIATIPNMTQPNWTSDGRLIMAGTADGGGVYLSDSSFSQLTKLEVPLSYPAAPALSPDGKTVVFAEGNTLWLVSSDGSNPRSVLNQPNLTLFGYPAWSPDSQWLAVAAAEPYFEAWSWILVLPVNGNTREAQRLVLPSLDPINVSRDSRITWR